MKKLISVILMICLALMAMGAMAEGRQTASAVLDWYEGVPIDTTVDLTGGWSVEFASGAFYLYDGEPTEEGGSVIIGVSLEKEVYEEYLAEAETSDSRRELENAVCYETEDDTYYLIAVGSNAYFMLDVPGHRDDSDEILGRVTLINAQEQLEAELATLEATEEESVIPEAAYEGDWIADRAVLNINDLDDVIYCVIEWGSSATESSVWEYECSYDEVADELNSLETGVKRNVTYGEDGEIVQEEIVFEDGAASFKLNEDGTLTWTDFKETPGENELVFERLEKD